MATQPGSGVTGAALTFTMPATPGTYNVRFFRNNTLTVLATSATITVLGPSIGLSATTGGAGRDGDGDDRERAGQRAIGSGCIRRAAASTLANRLAVSVSERAATPPGTGVTGRP